MMINKWRSKKSRNISNAKALNIITTYTPIYTIVAEKKLFKSCL